MIAMEAFLGLPSKNRHRLSGWRLAAGNFLPSSDVLMRVVSFMRRTFTQVTYVLPIHAVCTNDYGLFVESSSRLGGLSARQTTWRQGGSKC